MSQSDLEDTDQEQAAEQSGSPADADPPADEHLETLEDGCGCAEVWEHLSEEREE